MKNKKLIILIFIITVCAFVTLISIRFFGSHNITEKIADDVLEEETGMKSEIIEESNKILTWKWPPPTEECKRWPYKKPMPLPV